MVNWATDFIDAIGLVGVALLVALENVFPPIPSELVLLLTGFNVSQGRFDVVSGIIAATIGSVVGAYVLYGAGRLLTEERLEALLGGLGRFVGLKKRDVEKGYDWFERNGTMVVLFGRLVPVVRSVISIPAGADKMPFGRFTLLTTAGSAVWNSVWVCIGWALEGEWQQAEKWGSAAQLVTVVALAAGLAFLVIRQRRRRLSGQESAQRAMQEQ